MPGQKRPTLAKVAALLNRHRCPTPFHAVRTRFMGTIVSPVPDRSPIRAIQELWGGNLPEFDSMDALNQLLQVLVDGLWNRLTAHQTPGNPFRLTPVQVRPTRESVHCYALTRKQEIDGFMDGLCGPDGDEYLSEGARRAADSLRELWAMLGGCGQFAGRSRSACPA